MSDISLSMFPRPPATAWLGYNDSVGDTVGWHVRAIHQCLCCVSHFHMSVRAQALLIASVRHLSPTRGERWGGWYQETSWRIELEAGQQPSSV